MAGEVLPSSGKPNKIVYGGETLIDLTADTVTPGTLKKGVTAHAADGSRITGTMAQPEPVQESDINFYDYDGTILHAWSLAELQGKTELPELPTQPGLICQGWNWTLAELKATNRKMVVGAVYITDDGATRLHIHLREYDDLYVRFQIRQYVSNDTTINWGDGTTESLIPGAGWPKLTHTYAAPGEYTISLKSATNKILLYGIYSSSDNTFRRIVEGINLGGNINYLEEDSFSDWTNLRRLTIPNNIISAIKARMAQNAPIECLVIPHGVTQLGDYACLSMQNMEHLSIPATVTSAGISFVDICRKLKELTLPDAITVLPKTCCRQTYALNYLSAKTITKIDGYAFQYSGISEFFADFDVSALGESALTVTTQLQRLNLNGSYTALPVRFIDSSSIEYCSFGPALETIATGALKNCYSAKVWDFSACTAVPTLEATDVFTGIPGWGEIRVPAALLAEWKAATNWATYADHIVGV